MKANFPASLAAVLQSEGGYVDDPRDGGGATNKGVTQVVYDDWRRGQGLDPRGVRSIEQAEVEAIYRKLYWNAVSGDWLPIGVDYCTFDLAVNSGPHRAARFLQAAAGVAEDGQIGPVTFTAVSSADPATLIDDICDLRIGYLRQLSNFDHFGHGWAARVAEVRARAKGMIA